MRISIGQILILALIFGLLFGDLQSLRKRLLVTFKQVKDIFQEKNRKKGT